MIYAVILTLFISGHEFSQIEIVEVTNCKHYIESLASEFIETGEVERVEAVCIDLEMRGV